MSAKGAIKLHPFGTSAKWSKARVSKEYLVHFTFFTNLISGQSEFWSDHFDNKFLGHTHSGSSNTCTLDKLIFYYAQKWPLREICKLFFNCQDIIFDLPNDVITKYISGKIHFAQFFFKYLYKYIQYYEICIDSIYIYIYSIIRNCYFWTIFESWTIINYLLKLCY